MVEHILTISNEANGACSCNTTFVGNPSEVAAAWQNHLKIEPMMLSVQTLVHAEYEARKESERIICQLLELGATSTDISLVIGTDENLRPLMSKTTIQRLGREGFAQSPRRRRKS